MAHYKPRCPFCSRDVCYGNFGKHLTSLEHQADMTKHCAKMTTWDRGRLLKRYENNSLFKIDLPYDTTEHKDRRKNKKAKTMHVCFGCRGAWAEEREKHLATCSRADIHRIRFRTLLEELGLVVGGEPVADLGPEPEPEFDGNAAAEIARLREELAEAKEAASNVPKLEKQIAFLKHKINEYDNDAGKLTDRIDELEAAFEQIAGFGVSKLDLVFENAPTWAQLCEEAGIHISGLDV